MDFSNLSDLLGAFFGDDLFGTSRRPSRGGDAAAAVDLTLVEAAFGVTREVEVEIISPCDRCDGSGAEPGTTPQTCPSCGGSGHVQHVSNTAFGQFVQTSACPACRGRGARIDTPCTACRGRGRRRTRESVEVQIPAGIMSGQRLRMAGPRPRRRVRRRPRRSLRQRHGGAGRAASSARATTSCRCSTCRSRAPRSARRRRSRRWTAARARGAAGHAARRGAAAARQGHPGAGRPRPRRPPGRGQRARAAQADATSSAPCSTGSRPRSTTARTPPTTASSTGCGPRFGEALLAARAGGRGRAGARADARPLPRRRRGGARRRRRRLRRLRRRPPAERPRGRRRRSRAGRTRWRAYHRPVTVGRIWVGPPWARHEGDSPRKVVIDPGRAFGTGGHGSTRAALELLQQLAPRPALDLGCGSGVLAIAAAKLGFGPLRCFDLDPLAVGGGGRERRAKRRRARGGPGRRPGRPAPAGAALDREPRARAPAPPAARPDLPARILVSGLLGDETVGGGERVCADGWAAELVTP